MAASCMSHACVAGTAAGTARASTGFLRQKKQTCNQNSPRGGGWGTRDAANLRMPGGSTFSVRGTLLLALLILSTPGIPAWSADFYVSTTGRDQASGSMGDPWATIQHAVTRVSPGDTVHVAPGSYFETVSVSASGTREQPIRILSTLPQGAKMVGGTVLHGWRPCASKSDCFGSPAWKNVLRTEIPTPLVPSSPRSALLVQGRNALKVAAEARTSSTSRVYEKAKGMKPLADSRNASSCNAIFDPSLDPGHGDIEGASLWIWSHAANNVIFEKSVTAWDPELKRLEFAPPLPPKRCLTLQGSSPDAYLLGNRPAYIQAPGDYAIRRTPGGSATALVWPDVPITSAPIHIGSRPIAFHIRGNHIVIDGFAITNFGTGAPNKGVVTISNAHHVELKRLHIEPANAHGVHVEKGSTHVRVENSTFRDIAGRGIQFISAAKGVVTANQLDNIERTAIYFSGPETSHFIVAGNLIQRQGQHGNGSAIYQCAGRVLYVDNRFLGTNAAITTNPCSHDVHVFRNVFEVDSDNAIAMWGGGVEGSVTIINNVILHASTTPRKSALSTANNPEADSYLWINNLIAGSCHWMHPKIRQGNAWKIDEYCWNQEERYGWSLAATESEIPAGTPLFRNRPQGDFVPIQNGPLEDRGVDPFHRLPAPEFPEFDFGPRCEHWSIGAHPCGRGPETGRGSPRDYVAPILNQPTALPAP